MFRLSTRNLDLISIRLTGCFEVVGDFVGDIEDVGDSQVSHDLFVLAVELVTKVEPAF